MKYNALAAVFLFTSMNALAADPVYTTAAPAGSACKVYDVSDIILSIDKNRDGKLTNEEWQTANAPPSSYKMIEKDSKGYILPAEFTATAPPPTIDANKDCKITLAEMQAMEKSMGSAPPPGGNPPPANSAPPAPAK
ncbi:MAG: hypothetical protein QM808_04045 [Steroidobacteraceae bacterium]